MRRLSKVITPWLVGAVVAAYPLLPASHLHEDSAASSAVVHRHLPPEHHDDHDAEGSPLADEHALTARPLDVVVVAPPAVRAPGAAALAERLPLTHPPAVRTPPPPLRHRSASPDTSMALPSRAPPPALFPFI